MRCPICLGPVRFDGDILCAGCDQRVYACRCTPHLGPEDLPSLTPTASEVRSAKFGQLYRAHPEFWCRERQLREAISRAIDLEGELEKWHEREAAACPEDQTFEETIFALRVRLTHLETERSVWMARSKRPPQPSVPRR